MKVVCDRMASMLHVYDCDVVGLKTTFIVVNRLRITSLSVHNGHSRGRWFNPTYRRFETYAISFTSHLPVSFGRDGGPLYLVSMPGEVKDPTDGVNV